MMTRKHNLLNLLVYRGSVALAVDTFIWKLIEIQKKKKNHSIDFYIKFSPMFVKVYFGWLESNDRIINI